MEKTWIRQLSMLISFHMELAGSPFDMTLNLKTPVSDPEFNGSMVGKIDLTALSKRFLWIVLVFQVW